MIKFPNTLTFRLTFWYALTFIGLLIVAVLVLYFSTQAILDIRIDEDLREDVEEFSVLMTTAGIEQVVDEINREHASSDNEEFFIQILNASGEVLYSTDLKDWQGLAIDKQLLRHALSEQNESFLTTIKLDSQDEEVRVVYAQIAPDTILHIGESTEEKEEILEIILIVFCVMLLFVIPLASVIGWFIAKQAVQGIAQVSRAAQGIEQGDLNRKVDVHGQPDEIQTLVNTFNAMATRIATLISEMREMIDNIAHDLRSPVGRIRAISESSLSGTTTPQEFESAASDTLEECDRLIQLINTTLDVAEAEAGVSHAAKEVINLSALIEDACELFAPAAEQKQISLSCQLDENCHFKGEKSSLQRMLSNLLDNAIKYSTTNSQIKVQLKNKASHIDIAVSDNGIGIPVPDQTRIFDRFFRCDASRTKDGCGLGLSFARAVVRAHGGNISLQSELNQGSTFVISLPLQRSS